MAAQLQTEASGRPGSRAAQLRAALWVDLADLAGSDARLFAFAKRAAWILVPLTLAIVVVVFGTGPEPRRNWYGDMLGNDFSQIWVAGRAALEGRGGEPYDLTVHLENLKAAFGPDCRFAWHYPPVFLLAAAAFAMLEPQPAFLIWTAFSLGVFALAMTVAAGRRDAACVALAHPLVFCNLSYGQNGLFTAALMTLGAMLVDRRPWLAGLCFGLLAYKPHFAALAPLLLLVTGRRACLVACIGTVLALCLASLALFGTAPWIGFFGTLGETNRIILQKAAAGLDLNASAFGAVRLLGGPISAAWALQAVVATVALGLAWRAWTMPAPLELRAAALLAAAPLLSPYVPVYDLAPLVPATLLLVLVAHRAGGLRPHERMLLIASPLFALLREGAGLTGFPLGLVLSLATLGCIAHRTRPWGLAAGRGPAVVSGAIRTR
ncbi:glycosyltransferase family 87 protein [Methylobacterium sp. NEAU K]|uniref:glycosyltransferase family 87 protein n=1 Tax=Methylobacterium sp. NEAU K TaxID=3064946 RepID=UPI002734559B|nr:glycosyltransferase family 87 protein [Methylobacterium sp. NEAU K]MDP4002926.1 glycosyltransferase family 87 protein [Methylobacterium sp. NEAU K]